MKSILISIQPKWCELIANGKKTIEVRKTRPKLETPFKVYIYCTKHKRQWLRKVSNFVREIFITENRDVLGRTDKVKSLIGDMTTFVENGGYNGKVIGEFVCDYIISHCEMANADIAEQRGCIKREKLLEYANGKELYGWHISNLVIYDKPRELGEFKHECNGICVDTKAKINCERFLKEGFDCNNLIPFKRPPQSWCYVEEKE